MDIFVNLKVYLVALSLSMLRLSIAFTVIPLTGKGMLPGMSRNALIMSLAIIIYPAVLETVPEGGVSFMALFPIFMKESLIGFMIGYMASIIFWMADGIGFLVDNQRGASMAMAFDPMVGEQTSPLGMMIGKAIITLFFSVGGFLALISVIYTSYVLWPVFSFTPSFNIFFPNAMLGHLDELVRYTFVYASPVMLLLFFSEFGLGLMNRFAPQLNVFFLSMPIKSGIAMFLFVLYASFILDYFKKEFLRIPNILHQIELLLQ